MQTAFQPDAFQTVPLAFQIQTEAPPLGGDGSEITRLAGTPALGHATLPMVGG
jgi:hypothetical protein